MGNAKISIELQQHYADKLAQRLRVLRFEQGVSQEYIAQHAGISTYTYQKYEKGESNPGMPLNPRLTTIVALARAFHIQPWELIRFEE